jgi:hypothetical protein
MNPLLVLAALLLLVLYIYRAATNRPHNFPPGDLCFTNYGDLWFNLKYFLYYLTLPSMVV